MNLEAYRVKVQRRLMVMRALVVVFLILLLVVPRLTGETEFSSFASGGSVGGGLVALVALFQQSRALKDDKKLRQLYIVEHDERQQAIRARAGQPMVLYLSVGMMMAAAVAFFFSVTVASTLALAAAAQVLVSLAVKLYCMKTM